MGYFTYRICKSVPLTKLKEKVAANLALYEPGTLGSMITVTLFEGRGCSAILLGTRHREDWFLNVGPQLGCVWMDVRYQDGDAWDLSLYEGAEHRCSHQVNPWAWDEEDDVKYDQTQIDYRIKKVCEFWPDQADRIRRHLLPWREPKSVDGVIRFVERKGKANAADEHEFGDANQIYDFVRQFGITDDSPTAVVGKDAPK